MQVDVVRRGAVVVGVGVALLASQLPGLAQAAPSGVFLGDPSLAAPATTDLGFPLTRSYPATATDRYELASGCWELRTADGAAVARTADGYDASAAAGGGEAFHLRAADLGAYLFFGEDEAMLAAAAAPPLPPGGSSTVTAITTPGEQGDWVVDEVVGGFTIQLPVSDEVLVHDGAALSLVPAASAITGLSSGDGVAGRGPDAADTSALGDAAVFTFHITDGCATWPEPEVNIRGAQPTGTTTYEEVEGYLDAHVHMMAFEFIGGEIRCGRPWSRYGVTIATLDCPDHETGGVGEAAVSSPEDAFGHDTQGWPTFVDWPAPGSLTHEAMYISWLERAWRGGLRAMVNLLVDNESLCEIYPLKRNECDETKTLRLETQRIRELERYVDAQWGGPGKGWFRIVTSPYEARRAINEGRLAVVLGIETSEPFGCSLMGGQALCDEAAITAHLDEFEALGVRQMELLNKFDNAFAGVAGDGGQTGVVTNFGNFYTTGQFLDMQTCPEDFSDGQHDREQAHVGQVDGNFRPAQDAIFGDLGSALPVTAVPAYPSGPHCNQLGLLPLGYEMVDQLSERGMLFDPDHLSAIARLEALDHADAEGMENVISSHSWSDPISYERILRRGGIVTPYAGGSEGFVAKYTQHKAWQSDRHFFGFGYGADTNGFGGQGQPRGADVPNPVTYPHIGFGGVIVDKQVSGERVYDLNVDGVAHYGLYADWYEDLRILGGDAMMADMARGPEAYLQVWERAEGVQKDRCLFSDDGAPGVEVLRVGMTAEEAVKAFGQPTERVGSGIGWCVPNGDGTAQAVVARFDASGRLVSAERSGVFAVAEPTPTTPAPDPTITPAPDHTDGDTHTPGQASGGGTGSLPATGGGLASGGMALLGIALLTRHGRRQASR